MNKNQIKQNLKVNVDIVSKHPIELTVNVDVVPSEAKEIEYDFHMGLDYRAELRITIPFSVSNPVPFNNEMNIRLVVDEQ